MNEGVKGKISAQPHPTLCIQFLNRENNARAIDEGLTLQMSAFKFFTVACLRYTSVDKLNYPVLRR